MTAESATVVAPVGNATDALAVENATDVAPSATAVARIATAVARIRADLPLGAQQR